MEGWRDGGMDGGRDPPAERERTQSSRGGSGLVYSAGGWGWVGNGSGKSDGE